MSEFNRHTMDAIDRVVDEKKESSKWEPDEMRSALVDVFRGVEQEEAAKSRSFSQATLSNRVQDVREAMDDIEMELEENPSLFRDPIEEAVEDFREFFENLNDEYGMGIKDIAIRMMVDEIRDIGQLPAPNYVRHFLDNGNTGVGNKQSLNWIVRRYEQWINKKRHEMQQHGDDLPVATSGFGASPTPTGGMGGQQFGGGAPPHSPQGQMGGQGHPPGRSSPNGHRPPNQQPQQHDQTDPAVEELREQVEELQEIVAHAVAEQDQDDESQMITIEQSDGSSITVPADDPRAQQLFEDEDEGMLEQMKRLNEAGLIVTPQDLQEMMESDDDGDEMSEISEAIETLGQQQLQAQQQISANFQEALESLREMEEENDDLTADDVEEMLEEKLTKSEVERVREEMSEQVESLQDKIEKMNRRSGDSEQDVEFMKKDREMEYQEKALDTLNENLRTLPGAVAKSVSEMVPAIKEVQNEGNPLWSPPGGAGRPQPQYVPEGVSNQQPAPSPADAARAAGGSNGRAPGGQSEAANSRPNDQPASGNEQEQQQSGGISPDRAQGVRERLGLEDDDAPEVEA